MKKWSRLTAFMLAFAIMLSNASGALALVEVNFDELTTWIQNVKEANGLGDVIRLERGGEVLVKPSTFVPTTEGPQYTVHDTVSLSGYASENAPVMDVTLEQYGKVSLAAPAAGQWQVYLNAADLWVNVANETGDTFELTFAKVQSLFEENNAAQLRCVMGDTVTETVNVALSYAASILPAMVEEEAAMDYGVRAAADSGIATVAEEGSNNGGTVYTVTIQYVLKHLNNSEEVAATPEFYDTEDRNNDGKQSLDQSIELPSIVGYQVGGVVNDSDKPYDEDSGIKISDNILKVKLDDITSNMVIKVVYEPAVVSYKVIHYQQNAENDDYTMVETEDKTGKTEDPVEVEVRDYPGFYPLRVIKLPAIASDGSTVVELYYDRNYYLMTFDMAGGTGMEAIYARYGAAIDTTAQPTRPGYTFTGWVDADGKTVTLPDKMPAENRRYTATWETGLTTYNVIFWYENANDDGYSVAGTYGPVTATPGVTVMSSSYANQYFEGRDEAHFTYNPALTEVETVAGDGSTVLNVYFVRNKYTLLFYGPGEVKDCQMDPHEHVNACWEIVCTIEEHTHSDDCGKELICTLQPHEHDDGCLSCEKTEHIHDYDGGCCTLQEHVHSIDVCCKDAHKVFGIDASRAAHTLCKWFFDTDSYGWWTWGCNTNGCPVGYEHTHGTGDCNTLKDEEHAHTEACYSDLEHTHDVGCWGVACGKVEHVHTQPACYLLTCTDIEHVHGEDCSEGNIVIYVAYAKYGANIGAAWSSEEVKTLLDSNYMFQYSLDSKLYAYLEKMPGRNSTMTALQGEGDGNTTYSWDYCIEVLPGAATDPEKAYQKDSSDGKNYEVYYSVSLKGSDAFSLTHDDYYFEIDGFVRKYNSVQVQANTTVHLFYDRAAYELTFNNRGTTVENKGGTFVYEQSIENQEFQPDYPANLEPGGFEFEGWYTTPECNANSKFNFEKATMPAKDLTLYANWVRKPHEVNVYLTSDMLATEMLCDTQIVTHGEFAVEPETPENQGFEFKGWFYVHEGVEKAFDFETMPVMRDMDVYAKWSSDVYVDYTVHYYVYDTTTPVADSTKGSAFAASTLTFTAKGAEELYAEYKEGYFPQVKSHSLLLKPNAENEFIFYYVQKANVPYIVRYVSENGEVLLPQYVQFDNKKAVVNVQFKPVEIENPEFGVVETYMPDAYQKRLVVNDADTNDETIAWILVEGPDGSEVKVHPDNVITFVYKKDAEHAFYKVTHITESLDKPWGDEWDNTWRENGFEHQSQQIVGVVGTTGTATARYEQSPLDITGFKYVGTKYIVRDENGNPQDVTPEEGGEYVLTERGVEIELYYVRESYKYEVRYLEWGTNTPVADPKTKDADDNPLTGKYEERIEELAKDDIEGYVVYGDAAKSIFIKAEGDGANNTPVQNVITFYYEKEITLSYVAVGPDHQPLDESVATVTPAEEKLPALHGEASGSTVELLNTAAYKFEGWYSDADCTNLLTTEYTYTPTKADDEAWKNTTYYAKFEWNVADVTITKNGLAQDDSAIFVVEGYNSASESKQTWYIALHDGESAVLADMKINTQYTITELGSWSVYYNAAAIAEKTVQPYDENGENTQNTVTISNTPIADKWLHDESYVVNFD